MMRWPAAEIDWLARSPPWREPACPADGESVFTHLRRKGDQVEVLASIQRKLGDILAFDDGAHGAVLRLKQIGRSCNLDGFGNLADLEGEVQADGLLNLHFNIGAGLGLESGVLGFQVVG